MGLRLGSDPNRPASLHEQDRFLVRRVLAGDEAAFETLFEGSFHGLYRFALVRVGQDPELAREVTQATLCKAFEKLHTYRGEAPLFSWLCSICRFEISAFHRRTRLHPMVALIDDTMETRGALETVAAALEDPESSALRQEVVRWVHVTIDHLPSHYGRVLEWKYADGLSVKEIAVQLGTTPKAAESLLTRARRAFRDGFTGLAAVGPGRKTLGTEP
jgi:RNA polymerase sigma-70 factor (ECF subfamily)